MAAWKMIEPTDTWEDVCERAYFGEPQYVSRYGVPSIVVISLAQYEGQIQKVPQGNNARPKNDFSCFFGKTKLKGDAVKIQRSMRDEW